MALTDTIQCDGVTTAFTLTRAVTTKESLSLTIASGASAGLVVSPSDYSFSPVNSVSQSVTITWANAVNYGTVGTPVDVTVAIYHNPGADPADTLLYSYDSASAMRPEMVGRDMEHIIDLVKMVIGTADLATTSLGAQEDDIAALDVRVTAAEATIVTHTAQIAALDGRLDTAEPEIDALQANDAVQDVDIADLQTSVDALSDSIGSPVGVPTVPNSVTASEADSGSPLYILGATTLGVAAWVDLISNVNALLATANADNVVWVAGGYVDDIAGGGDAASATIATPTAPVLRSLSSAAAATLIGGTSAHATKWAVEDSANADPYDARLWMPTALSGAGYTVLDFEVTAFTWDGTAGNLTDPGSNIIEIRAVTASNLWTLYNVPGGAGRFIALTIKRVKAI